MNVRWMILAALLAGLGAPSIACVADSGAEDTDTDTDANTGTISDSGAASTDGSSGGTDAATTAGSGPGSTTTPGATSTSTSTSSEGTTTAPPTETDDESTDSGAACNKPTDAGLQTGLTIDVDGTSRSYDLFVPPTYDGTQQTPLVLNYHGLTGSPDQQMRLSGFNEVAAERGMLVAYPQGIGNSFNSGLCCGTAFSSGVDDVAFARALVQHASTLLCIDPQRVYVMGMSNGGHMAHLLACEAADIFAAGASVTGVLNLAPGACNPSRPISFLDFHGTGDNIVPFGGTGLGFPRVDDMMADWADRNGCGTVADVTFDEGDMTCETWPACSADVDVTLCTIDGGGHCWPGSGPCILGANSDARDASVAIADLFDAHRLE